MDLYIITDNSPEEKYIPKNKPGIHDSNFIHKSGQRKLLISEISFLTRNAHLSDTIVYAGAAPGTHLMTLIKLFPMIKKWILYDPRPIKIVNDNKDLDIRIINTLFTVEEAMKYNNDNVLFISDIRSYDSKQGKVPIAIANKTIKRDMKLQKELVESGNFIMSLLKFRLPWESGITEYFDGNLHLTPWLGEYSPELRLVTDGKSYKSYDNDKLDNQMYYYNSVTRRQNHDMMKDFGLDHTYQDQVLELCIIKDYLHLIKNINYENIEEAAIEFIKKNCNTIKASPKKI